MTVVKIAASVVFATSLAMASLPKGALAQSEAEAAISNFGLAVDLCLQHVQDRDPVEAFRAAGFQVTATDEGSFDFEAPGVSGFLSPLLLTGWCWVGSDAIPYSSAETIAFERAVFRYPDGTSGPAERGWSIEISPSSDCSGLTVRHANSIHTLILTNVPHWTGCESAATGAVYFN